MRQPYEKLAEYTVNVIRCHYDILHLVNRCETVQARREKSRGTTAIEDETWKKKKTKKSCRFANVAEFYFID